tara:strand:+ start:3064 stop:3366 length:303 start_codon:yes stop_codon:yes gene_type:complete
MSEEPDRLEAQSVEELSWQETEEILDDEDEVCSRCCNETAQPYFVQEQYFVGDPADEDVDVREVPCPECNENNWRNKKTCPECNGVNQCKTCNGEGLILK